MPVAESKLADIRRFGLLAEPRYFQFGWTNDPRILGRDTAILALLRAQLDLPPGLKFKVWDMQRTREIQLAMIESFRLRIKEAHPEWPISRVEEEIRTFAAAPLPDEEVTRPDCHRNGGAVDLTIIDANGTELDMGTDHDDLTDRAASMYFEGRPNHTDQDAAIRNNRRMLRAAMQSAGWEMLPSEWWHWSTSE